MAELKQGRWVKVHEPGQANYVESENVMDIVIGTGRCQAEATYTVRSYKKAAYWLEEYLKAAEAMQIVAADILEQIKAAADSANREDDEVSASGEGWSSVTHRQAGPHRVHIHRKAGGLRLPAKLLHHGLFGVRTGHMDKHGTIPPGILRQPCIAQIFFQTPFFLPPLIDQPKNRMLYAD